MESSWNSGATAPSTDPIIHLLHRFTYGPTKKLVAEVNKLGADTWFEKQLDHLAISDTSISQIPSLFTSLIFINLVEYLYGRDSFIFVTYSDTSILAPFPIFKSYWSS